MRYAVSVPAFGEYFEPRVLAALAHDAERAGWDGFFVWDHVQLWPTPIADPWIGLAAIALATDRLRIGPLVTPLPRRRPVKLAREVVTLDHLSGGRLTLGVGIGAGPWEWEYLGEEASPRVRAAMLDEMLELLCQLWTGEPTLHRGPHYQFRGDGGPGDPSVRPTPLLPRPVQVPRVPIWVAGGWPLRAPFRRAARWDGVVPMKTSGSFTDYLTPDDTRQLTMFIAQQRASEESFDVIISGHTGGADDASVVAAHAEVGATWWLEDISPWPFGWSFEGPWPIEAMNARVRGGPPRR